MIKNGAIVSLIALAVALWGFNQWQGVQLNKARKANDELTGRLVAAKTEIVYRTQERVIYATRDKIVNRIKLVKVPSGCDAVIDPWRAGIDGLRRASKDVDNSPKP